MPNKISKPFPKFGMLTNPIYSVDKEIIKLAKLGFDFVEIGIEEPFSLPQILIKQKNLILNLLEKYKMPAIGHTAYWVHFGSSHEKARRGWIEEAKDMIQAAAALKINLLNFHFYGRFGQVGANSKTRMIFVKNFTDSMRELVEFAKSRNITLMLENVPTEDTRLNGIEDFSYVMKKLPSLKFHFDIAHAFIEGGMERIKEYLDSFSDKLVHIHIHDNHGKDDEHLPLGKGKINFVKVVKWLKETDYNRTITFEVFTSQKDAVRSREFLKKLWHKF